MAGDNAVFDQSANQQSDGNPPHGAVEFGVDLSKPHGQFKVGQSTDARGLYVKNPGANPPRSFPIDSTIGSISLPAGWHQPQPPAASPGANVFQVKNGTSFVPPVSDRNSSSVEIHVGLALDSNRVSASTEFNLHQLLKSKPATNGPQELTAEEFKSIANIVPLFEGGNNQYNPNGSLFPKFDVTSASTVNINGKTGVLVKGNFESSSGSGAARETIYFPNNQGGIEQVSISAPQDKVQQYEKQFRAVADSIQWQ